METVRAISFWTIKLFCVCVIFATATVNFKSLRM